MINWISVLDELEKIAASRWRTALRAGDLGRAERDRLLGSGLLDYGREIAGLEKGTNALVTKHNIIMHEPSFRELGAGVGEVLTGKGGTRLGSTIDQMGMASVGMGGMSRVYPGGVEGDISMLPREVNPISLSSAGLAKHLGEDTDLASQGAYAVAKRHELDETLEGMRLLKKYEGGIPDKYMPFKTPSGIRERIGHLVGNLQRRAQGLGPSDTMMGGIHTSPKVVFHEGGNLAMMPTAVRQNFKGLRSADAEILSGAGYRPDILAPARDRRQFMKAWERNATRNLTRRVVDPVAEHVEHV